MLNKVILTGRLTAAPELKRTESDIPVLRISVAVQRSYKAADGSHPTDFINIVAWRNTAEFIAKHFEKGQMIALAGFLQQRSYEDRDGVRRSAYEVVADEAHFCGSSAATGNLTVQKPAAAAADSDDDLPF